MAGMTHPPGFTIFQNPCYSVSSSLQINGWIIWENMAAINLSRRILKVFVNVLKPIRNVCGGGHWGGRVTKKYRMGCNLFYWISWNVEGGWRRSSLNGMVKYGKHIYYFAKVIVNYFHIFFSFDFRSAVLYEVGYFMLIYYYALSFYTYMKWKSWEKLMINQEKQVSFSKWL